MTRVKSLSDVTSDVTTLAELKFTLEKWRKGEFDVRPKRRIAGYYCSLHLFVGSRKTFYNIRMSIWST